MSKLTKKFAAQRQPLMEELNSLKKIQLEKGSNRKQFKKFIIKLRNHLKKIDKTIIAELVKRKKKAKTLNNEYKFVLAAGTFVTEFSRYMGDKYSRKDVLVGYTLDIKHLAKIMKKRCQIEDKLIFPEYDEKKLKKPKKPTNNK